MKKCALIIQDTKKRQALTFSGNKGVCNVCTAPQAEDTNFLEVILSFDLQFLNEFRHFRFTQSMEEAPRNIFKMLVT